ncbi:MAG: UDP-glucose 4-epimerase GalE [Pseudomonadota bacterium]
MRIAVTGGAGYIGSHTVVELLSAGHDVLIVDNFRNSSPEVISRIQLISNRQPQLEQISVLDEQRLETALVDFQPDGVIHFAGLKAVGEAARVPLNYYQTNVEGSLKLFRAMEKAGCHHLVFSSSATVYGHPDRLPVDEGQPCRPTNAYGRTKEIIERVIRDWGAADDRVSAVSLRYFNPVGAHETGEIGEDPNGVPDNLMPFVAQVAVGRREELSVFGRDYDTPDGTGLRDYIHVVDLALAHLAALEFISDRTGVDEINVGTGRGHTVMEMISAFENASGQRVAHKFVGRRAGDTARSVADVQKSRKLLGWTATRNLDRMCRDTWNWQNKNPNGLRPDV